MADETTAPLSDAEIAKLDDITADDLSADELADLRDRYAGDSENEMLARILGLERVKDAALATLAAYREIVAAVAQMHTNDMRRAVAGSPDLITRARALLATSTPPATDAAAAQEE